MKYCVITPAKNEQACIENTIRSMLAQTVHPESWVIVNDGSTDSTADICKRYARKNRFMKIIDSGISKRARGGHVVDLFYKGLKEAEGDKFQFISKLDADISFPAGYFETILRAFEKNPKLGITSGISHVIRNGRLVEERSSPGHTLGAAKVYRKDCFDAINGLVPCMGWDGIDEIKARMKGWEAEPVKELHIMHHRPEGKANGFFCSGIERGKGSYYMGYHPLYMLARSVKSAIIGRPPLVDGAGMMAGYIISWIKGDERISDEEFIRFLRKNQMRKLFLLESKV